MARRAITSVAQTSANVVDGLTGPFYPSRNVVGILNTTEYFFSGVNGGQHTTGSSTVFGKPRLAAGQSGTLTNQNAPFIYNTTTDQWEPNGTYLPAERRFSNSIVASDENGVPDFIEERVTYTLDNATQTGLTFGNNTCQPVFYGVDFVVVNSLGFGVARGTSAPAFFGCSFSHSDNQGNWRWEGGNFLVRGLTMYNTNDIVNAGSLMEFLVPPTVGPVGLTLLGPNFPSWGDRITLPFVNIGAAAANRYLFLGLLAPGFPIYQGAGGGGGVAGPDRGATHINPQPSPVPYSRAATYSADNVVPIMSIGSSDVNGVLRSGSGATFQTFDINFDATGYTLRIRREEIESWTHTQGSTSAVDVEYLGLTKPSAGVLDFTTGDTNSTTPTLGGGVQTTNEAQESINWEYVPGDEMPGTVIWDGYDATVAGDSIQIQLPVSHQISKPGSGGGFNADGSTVIKFFRYTLWAHHDERGITQIESIDFTPESADTYSAVLGTGENITLNLTSLEDSLFTNDLNLQSGLIDSDQDVYDSVKKYTRVRDQGAGYSASHLDTEFVILTSNGTSVDLGALNLGHATAGRTVQSTGLTVTGDVYTAGTINVRSEDTWEADSALLDWTTTGTIDLDVFAGDADNRVLTATSLLNLPAGISGGVLSGNGTLSPGTYSNLDYTTGAITFNDGAYVFDGSTTFDGATLTIGTSTFSATNGATPETIFGAGGTPSGFTQIFPDIFWTISAEGFDSAAGFGNLHYRVLDANGVEEFAGNIAAGATTTLTVERNSILAEDWAITLVGAGYNEAITIADYAGGDATFTVTEDGNFNRQTDASTAVTVDTTPETNNFGINIVAGTSLLGAVLNASIGALKSSDQYADYISEAGLADRIIFRNSNSATLFADGTNRTYINVAQGGTSDIRLQNCFYSTGAGADISLETTTDGSWQTAIVNPLTIFTSLTDGGAANTEVNITVTFEPNSSVDIGGIGAEVETRLIDNNIATGGNITSIGDSINTNISNVANDVAEVKADTERAIEDINTLQ